MIDHFLPYIIPAILTLLVGLLLWAVKKERIALEYDVVESDAFPIKGGVGKYFVSELTNTGNRAVENISFKIDVDKGVIDSINYSSAQLINVTEQTDTGVRGLVSLLNPKERLSAILTIKDAADYSKIVVEARAVGATATKKGSQYMPDYIAPLLAAIATGAVALAAVSVWTSFTQSRVTKSIEQIGNISSFAKDVNTSQRKLQEWTAESEKTHAQFEEQLKKLKLQSEKDRAEFQEQERKEKQGEPDREEIVFATLNRSGLSQAIPGLIRLTGNGLPFWKTGLYLMDSYLLDRHNSRKYVNAIVALANADAIAPSSKGFLLYLAGKIEKAEGHSDSAIKYFTKCKKETPLMYEYLMAQDPAYDLASVRMWLTKNKLK